MDDFLKTLKSLVDKIEGKFKSDEEKIQEIRDYYEKENEYMVYSVQLQHLKHRLELFDFPIKNEEQYKKFINSYKLKIENNPPKLLKKSHEFVDKFLRDFLEMIKKEKEQEQKS